LCKWLCCGIRNTGRDYTIMARKKREKDNIDLILDTIDFKGLTKEKVVGQDGLIKQLTGKILQRMLDAELTHHLGYDKNSKIVDNSGNSRNGYTEKTILLENQSSRIEVPRDRNGTFEPIIVPKHQKHLPIFNEQIISMYSRGMTNRDIKAHLEEMYNIEVSADLISRVTESVMEEVREWQNRQLEKTYVLLYLDGIRVKSKEEGKSCQKTVYVALGVDSECQKEVLVLWISGSEGAKFWIYAPHCFKKTC